MSVELPDKQYRVYMFVKLYCKKNGYSPYYKEISSAVGIPNISAVRKIVMALVRKGYFALMKNRRRGIIVIEDF